MNEIIQRSAQTVRERIGSDFPSLALVLGSGWDSIAADVDDVIDIPYAELPAFPVLGVAGHAGMLRVGRVGGRAVALLRGRKHAYETGDAAAMKGAIRTLAALGTRVLLQTNAAGSLDASMPPGSLMLLSDHLNLVQRSPLFGDTGNDRFVDMSGAYDAALRVTAHAVAARAGVALHEGVYAWLMGPQFETPAEIRMLRGFGAQAVGMSTVPETILARHAGLRVLAVSMMTNMASGLDDTTLSHAHTLSTAKSAAGAAAALLRALIPAMEA